MAVSSKPVVSPTGRVAGAHGNLAGTDHLGVIFLEYVNVERKVDGVWAQVALNAPATFEPVSLHRRLELATWTHKPLLCLWLMPSASLQDGDRVVRRDGSRWYVRGAPLLAPGGTHIAALAEAAAEDGLFAALSPDEPE